MAGSDEFKEGLVVLGGSVMGSLALGIVLVRWIAQQDPGFPEQAKAQYDEFLGRLSAQIGIPAVNADPDLDITPKSREVFRMMIAEAVGSQAPQAAPPKKKLRRRIFEWFERG